MKKAALALSILAASTSAAASASVAKARISADGRARAAHGAMMLAMPALCWLPK